MNTLYSLRTYTGKDKEGYTITKFVDGDVESSYFLTRDTCECPAGHRSRCRHRQMLPAMLNEGIVNTHWFWSFECQSPVDFDGTPKRVLDSLTQPAGMLAPAEAILQPHSETVITEAFDASIGGSNPPAVATNKTATEIANTPLPPMREPILEDLVDRTLAAIANQPAKSWRRL